MIIKSWYESDWKSTWWDLWRWQTILSKVDLWETNKITMSEIESAEVKTKQNQWILDNWLLEEELLY